jgi:hypothetical protein
MTGFGLWLRQLRVDEAVWSAEFFDDDGTHGGPPGNQQRVTESVSKKLADFCRDLTLSVNRSM